MLYQMAVAEPFSRVCRAMSETRIASFGCPLTNHFCGCVNCDRTVMKANLYLKRNWQCRQLCPQARAHWQPSSRLRTLRSGRFAEHRLELVERAAPALLVAARRRIVGQARMGEGQFSAFGDRTKDHLDLGGFGVAGPEPGHAHALRRRDLEKLAEGFVLVAHESAKAETKAAADTRIGLGEQHGTGVRPPPSRDAFRRDEQVEQDRRPRRDAAHERDAGHRPAPFGRRAWVWLISVSRASASAVRRSRLTFQKRS